MQRRRRRLWVLIPVAIAAVIAVWLVWGIVQGLMDIASTGSGGIGAVSFGISEALIEAAALFVVAVTILGVRALWRSWTTPHGAESEQSQDPGEGR
jgi:hypothetical protein